MDKNTKELENRDLGIYESNILTTTDFKLLNKYKEELELANKVLQIKVKNNSWEVKERTFYKTNSRLLLAISYRRRELKSKLPWYSLTRFLV